MLFKISWRNIWRSRARSLVIIIAIILGIIGGNFSASVRLGVEQQNFRETVENQTSHIQIHHPDFIANPEARYRIPEGNRIADEIRQNEGVRSVSARTVVDGMAASANMNTGVRIKGVDPDREDSTSGLAGLITEGGYFGEEGRLPALIAGRELAEKLHSGVGSRIVLTFQGVDGEMISASFRIEGLFEVSSLAFEGRNIFVRSEDLNELIGDSDAVTEIAVLLNHPEGYRKMAGELQQHYPETEVRHWADLQPALYYSLEFLNRNLIWLVAIIILGVSFGLLNTILMSVLERIRELGILMAIGMKKARVFGMIVLETSMLAFIGGIAGLALSRVFIGYLNNRGLDLSNTGGEGMGEFGYASVIYPELETSFYLQVAVVVMIFAVIAALYPAWKAIRLVPSEAVREE